MGVGPEQVGPTDPGKGSQNCVGALTQPGVGGTLTTWKPVAGVVHGSLAGGHGRRRVPDPSLWDRNSQCAISGGRSQLQGACRTLLSHQRLTVPMPAPDVGYVPASTHVPGSVTCNPIDCSDGLGSDDWCGASRCPP